MTPILDEIANILTPNHTTGLIRANRLYQLQPLMPITQFLEMARSLDAEGQQQMRDFVLSDHVGVLQGVIYLAKKGFNFEGRLKELVIIYNTHLKQVFKEKKILIELYEKIPAYDIAQLVEDHVIFVLKPFLHGPTVGLAAIRYLPPYEIHYEKHVYEMPGCTIAIHIDDQFNIDQPEVIAEDSPPYYEHPFVFRDQAKFGQRICMGTFNHSTDILEMRKLRFANTINSLIKQSIQILVSGFSRGVNPANGILDSPQYLKYMKKKKSNVKSE